MLKRPSFCPVLSFIFKRNRFIKKIRNLKVSLNGIKDMDMILKIIYYSYGHYRILISIH